MRHLPLLLVAPVLLGHVPERHIPVNLHDFTVNTLAGKTQALAAFKGKVVLVVNVASECGFTPQYEGLQKLHAAYQGQGFAVLGFPCNQFGAQEPGGPEQIQAFCTRTYGVTFPLFEKLDVKGPNQAPVYAFLSRAAGEEPKWNFHKFVVGKDGKLVKAFPSKVAPESPELKAAIEAALRR